MTWLEDVQARDALVDLTPEELDDVRQRFADWRTSNPHFAETGAAKIVPKIIGAAASWEDRRHLLRVVEALKAALEEHGHGAHMKPRGACNGCDVLMMLDAPTPPTTPEGHER